MLVIIKMNNVSAQVIDNMGNTVLDYKVGNYELDADAEKLSAAVFELLTNVRGLMEQPRD